MQDLNLRRDFAEMMVADLPDAAADAMFEELMEEDPWDQPVFSDSPLAQSVAALVNRIERFSLTHVCLHTARGKVWYWPTTHRWMPKNARWKKAKHGQSKLLAYLQNKEITA